jgi:serine/threonine-protein kinase
MPITSSVDLVGLLRRHPLLGPDQLSEIAGSLQSQFPEARALARELVRRGWLTPFQINQLMLGRGDSLVLGSYVLLEKLGEGGMGAVYKARNWKLGRVVAVKVIRKERLDSETIVRRFRREIEAAAQLSHPNIVRAFDADEVGGTHLFVMEYVEGLDLARVVKERGPLPIALACECIRQAALALQHAQERGLVHRDIKPSNLLLSNQSRDREGAEKSPRPHGLGSDVGVVKLLDMGLARLERRADDASTTLTQEGAVMGTPDYISPEQALDSHRADIRADLYSLGCTLYYLLSGKVPFPGNSMSEKLLKHQLESPKPVRQLRPEVPQTLAAVVEKLMAKRPEQRYQTPAELAAALAEIQASGGRQLPDSTVNQGAHAPRSRAQRSRENPFADIDLPASETVVAGTTPGEHAPAPRRPWARMVAGAGSVLALGALLLGLLLAGGKPPSIETEKKDAPTKVERKPSVKEPARAEIILFDGKDLSGWVDRQGKPATWPVRDGYVEVGTGDIVTKQTFTDYRLHAEFWLPKGVPGNSGIYLHGRYEVQIYNSRDFPMAPAQRCGAIWDIAAPTKDAERQAEEWQTFDIEFRAPRPPNQKGRVSVTLNGEKVLDAVQVYSPTAMAVANDVVTSGPIMLQAHGDRVRFRNIRLIPLVHNSARGQQADEAKRLAVPMQITNSIGMKLNLIPAGRFLMGSPDNEPGRERVEGPAPGVQGREGPQHEVEITRPFYLGVHEVTVGQFRPNRYGLYDMHGNVWEWVADWYDKDYFANSPRLDPQGPKTGRTCVLRGGAWYYDARHARSARRNGDTPPEARSNGVGFRVVLVEANK